MKENNFTSFKQVVIACGVASLVACSGGGSDNNYQYGPQPSPTPGPGVNSAPVSVSPSTIGDVVTGKGTVSVLAPDANNQLVSQTRTNLDGFSLYTFDSDPNGSSVCTSVDCITKWPALLASSSAQANPPYTIITRGDGSRQWAIRDKPLYYFFQDNKLGDVAGDGAGNIWRVATIQPVLRNLDDLDNPTDPDGDYLVSSGSALTYVPAVAGDSSRFIPQRKTVDRLSLYTFDLDIPGVANCTDGCLINWPPLMAGPGDVATPPYSFVDLKIDSQGNTAKQWAYQGQPLYFYIEDLAQRDTIGKDKLNWRLARPLPYQQISSTALGSFLAGSGKVKTLLPDDSTNNTFSLATVNKDDFTVYTFATDTIGASNCEGGCLRAWPPVIADRNADPIAPFSLITRTSGELQWAINGKALYFFIQDMNATDIIGEGFDGGGIWNVARAAPVVVAQNNAQGTLFVSDGNTLVGVDGTTLDLTRRGYTLYTFDPDPVGGAPTCTGGCLDNWPALYARAASKGFGDFTIVAHPEGGNQWAYKGKPLYYFINDTSPGAGAGDAAGGAINNWTIARP